MLQHWSQQLKWASQECLTQEHLTQSPCSSRVRANCLGPQEKSSLCSDGAPMALTYAHCLILPLGTTEKIAPFWSKESHFPKGLLPTFTALCNCLGNLLLCTDLDWLHDKRILQKFSLVPMSANDRHEQAAEQRTMHRRDVLEIKIPVHFPIGIICSHSTKIHRQGVSQPKKRLLIFVEGLHKLLPHCPNLPLNEILMTAQFSY